MSEEPIAAMGSPASQALDAADPYEELGALFAEQALDPARPLVASAQLRRRQIVSRMIESGQTASAIFAVAVLAFVVYSVASRGASALSFEFLVKAPPTLENEGGGGIGPEILGTMLLIGVATVIAMPIGICAALYMTEFGGRRSARALRLVLDLLYGIPTIVLGLFVFGLLVAGKKQNGFAASVALAIIMLPLIARASQETLLMVPQGLRDASAALGVSNWRALRGVVLPSALGGILTATVLAVARAAGETAPVLLASSVFGNSVSLNFFGEAVPNIPVYIYKASFSDNPSAFARAWGAALVLLSVILLVNIAARTLHARSVAKMAG